MKIFTIALLILPAHAAMAKEIKVKISYLNPPYSLKFEAPAPCKSFNGRIKTAQISTEGKGLLISYEGKKEKKAKIEINCDSVFSLKYGRRERDYYGKLTLENEGGRIKVINSLDLEKYLESVVSAEVYDLKNYEAYKAQAVVARTYTLANIERHKRAGFNLCDTTHCQLYNGYGDLKEAAVKAVRETKGLILEYRGKPAWTFYHSICGGQTDRAADVWPYEKKPYLQSVKDGPPVRPYCSSAPGFLWRAKINSKKFEIFVRNKIFKANLPLSSIKIISRTPAGRVAWLEFSSGSYSKKVSGSDFYHLAGRYFGWEAIRSSMFNVSKEPKYIVFEGRGHGHGVGMCQHGADAMAGLGYDYEQILKHYYKEVKIVRRDL